MGFVLGVFLNSNVVVMPGETTFPTRFTATLAGVTVALKTLFVAVLASLEVTGLACVSVLPP